MGNSQNYRKRAQECALLAAKTESSRHKAVWLELEQHWLSLAEARDISGRVDPFTAFFMTGGAQSRLH